MTTVAVLTIITAIALVPLEVRSRQQRRAQVRECLSLTQERRQWIRELTARLGEETA